LLGKHRKFEKAHIWEQQREAEDLGLRIKFGLLKQYKRPKKGVTPLSRRYRA